jgi:hypothetical protein
VPASESRLSTLYVAAFAERSIESALALARALPALARERGAAVFATSLVRGPARILGSRQRPARFAGGVPVRGRGTTGTAAFVQDAALCHALALPRVDAVFAGATPKTLLNRNVRGFLRGYRNLGIKANWGGREYVRAGSRPLALLGYDLFADGSTLIEAFIGLDAPAVTAPSGGEGPGAALVDLVAAPVDPERVARTVAGGIADKYGLAPAPIAVEAGVDPAPRAAAPGGYVELSVPIGVLEAALARGPKVSIGGDVLGSNAAFDAVEERAARALAAGERLGTDVLAPLEGAPLEGARPEDVLRVLELALGERGP